MSHLSKFCGEKAHSRQQINDAPFEREISNGKAACGKVSRVHCVVLGESRAIRLIAWSAMRNRLNLGTPGTPISRSAIFAAPFGRLAFLDSTHFTAKTSTSAHVVPCGGTATKYSFSSGTNKPVLPSGPVGIFPMV